MKVTRKAVITGKPRTLGDRIAWARLNAGMSQRKLQKRAGITGLANNETSGYIPSLLKAARIARACGVSLDWLATGKGKP